jgi:hypothetical protein
MNETLVGALPPPPSNLPFFFKSKRTIPVLTEIRFYNRIPSGCQLISANGFSIDTVEISGVNIKLHEAETKCKTPEKKQKNTRPDDEFWLR